MSVVAFWHCGRVMRWTRRRRVVFDYAAFLRYNLA